MKKKPITFSISVIFLLLVALIWLSFGVITAVGFHPSYQVDTPLRWIMAGLALLASLTFTTLSILLWRGNRLVYILTLASLLFIAILTITDQVGIIDIVTLVITITPIPLLLINRRWYYQSSKKTPT